MSEKEVYQGNPGEYEEIDVKAILLTYLRHWYLFVLGVALCGGIAYTYLQYATPMYNIKSKILIKGDENGTRMAGGEAFSDLDMFKSTSNIDNEIEILKSKSLMQRVFAELSLDVTYYHDGPLQEVELFGSNVPVNLVVSRLDSAAHNKTIRIHLSDNNTFRIEEEERERLSKHQFGEKIEKPYGIFTVLANSKSSMKHREKPVIVKFHNIQKLANSYSQKLSVTQTNKMASVLTLSLTDAVREKGEAIISKLVEVYNKEAVEDKNLIASSTITFIDERLKYLSTELYDVEEDVERYKRNNNVTDVNSQVRLYLEEASDYNKQLADLGVKIDVLESIETYLNKNDENYQLVPSSLSIEDPTLVGLITRFNELKLERERLLRTTQPGNPLVKNMSEQLSNLRANILENLQNIKRGLTIARKNLETKSSQFGSRIRQVPAIERGLQEIGRQQGIKEALYLYLLKKREESGLSLASTVSNSRIVDPAMPDEYPISPKKSTTYLLAMLFGLGLPFIGIYLKEMFNDRVQVLKDVEQLTATPVLGEVLHHSSRGVLAVTVQNRSPIAELFRLIRTNLQFAAAGKVNKVILVTSSMSGEGKTFFSINLGASLALMGKRVVVVSLDLRKPRLMQDLGLPNEVGVTNYLVSQSLPVEKITVPLSAVPGLFLIGSGPIPPNPAELMISQRVDVFLDELKERFDYVILDSPPVGQVADAFTLSHQADSCIFLVRYGYTFKAQLEIIEDIYRNKKLKHPMIVLNDAKKKNGSGKGYGYGYGYGYGNSNGKVEKKKRKAAVMTS